MKSKIELQSLIKSLKEKYGRNGCRNYQNHFILDLPESKQERKDLEAHSFEYCVIYQLIWERYWEVYLNNFISFDEAQNHMKSWFTDGQYFHFSLKKEIQHFNTRFRTNLTPNEIENELKKAEKEDASDYDKLRYLKFLKKIKDNGDGYYNDNETLIVSDAEFQSPNFSSFKESLFIYSIKMIYNY